MRLALVLLTLLAIAGAAEAAHASTPANIALVAPLSNDEPIVAWSSVSGTDEYRLTGTIFALRVNANDAFCTPPLADDRQTLTLDETIEASATRFELPLPELPAEDEWFFFDTSVQLQAFDAEGVLLAVGSARGIGETNPLHCATIEPELPLTGSGSARGDGRYSIAYVLATVTVAGALGAFAFRRAVRG
jgi:hypothetical protein